MAEAVSQKTGSYKAVHKYARISARKARLVIDMIRGAPVESALLKLDFCHRRAAPMIGKVVRSAIANASQKAGVEAEQLVVWRAYVDEGPTMKRWRPRAMGRAFPRLRRTCHLNVELKEAEDKGRAGGGSSGGSSGDGSPATGQDGRTGDRADAIRSRSGACRPRVERPAIAKKRRPNTSFVEESRSSIIPFVASPRGAELDQVSKE